MQACKRGNVQQKVCRDRINEYFRQRRYSQKNDMLFITGKNSFDQHDGLLKKGIAHHKKEQ